MSIDANNPRLSPERQTSAEEFVRSLMERYVQYHEHKENMAYGGFTVFAGAVVAALVTDAWPPNWGLYTPTLAPGAALALFVVTFVYLRFQLHRRRWAALRIAGCEHVLAEWIQRRPTSDDLNQQLPGVAAENRSAKRVVGCLWCLLGWVWPPVAEVLAIERTDNTGRTIYPQVLAAKWRETGKTDAVRHEWIIFGTTWVLGVALLLRSCLCPCKIDLIQKHVAALICVSMAALLSMCIMILLRCTAGPIEFNVHGFEFKGASGPVVLWVVCFLAIVTAIKLLW
jgi:hypothetical protein